MMSRALRFDVQNLNLCQRKAINATCPITASTPRAMSATLQNCASGYTHDVTFLPSSSTSSHSSNTGCGTRLNQPRAEPLYPSLHFRLVRAQTVRVGNGDEFHCERDLQSPQDNIHFGSLCLLQQGRGSLEVGIWISRNCDGWPNLRLSRAELLTQAHSRQGRRLPRDRKLPILMLVQACPQTMRRARCPYRVCQDKSLGRSAIERCPRKA
jgi:hypothetical protein